ncbi:DUF3794 domain-containing protein [Iocasia frigidifontis]|uniref:DUF3794 domain-containing protein n=1 Tax=Iocasia fonsfrigidae TaxID=2682810 RepID=A0A8A7KC79_9FIRM|nr:SPOCS domain-containing protein [Iocasia fonsfrigidae]QTL99463.1 DUF3794 domain-containing protein [Iocasia fonsfrigidae]
MAINFDEELIRVEFVIGEDVASETVSQNITVPNGKPDIERVIDVKADLLDVESNIEDGGVEVTGTIEAGVVYVGIVPEDEPQQPVHFFEGQLTFTNFFDFPEAEPGMNVFVDINIRRVSWDFNENAPRTVEVDVVLSKFVKLTEYQQITVVTDVTGIPEENIVEELLRIEDVIGENTVTSVITGRLELPPGKPPIERVLKVLAEIQDVTTEITNEGVIVEGDIFGGAMYVADVEDGDQPVHFLEDTIHFTETVDVAGAEEDMTVHTNLTIKRLSFDFIDEDTVEIDVVVQFFVKVTEPKQVTVITDIISDLVEIERELLRVEDVVGEDVVHETISSILNIPPEKPLAQRIIEPSARIVEYEATTDEDGVYLEGDIEAAAVYVGVAEEGEFLQPVHFVETPEGNYFNFDNFIDIPGTEPGMNTHTEVEVTKVNASLTDCEEVNGTQVCSAIEFDIVIRKFAKVTEFRQMEIVTDLVVISPAADDECPPSYVVYVVQAGDTLWKIARRYRTTVDALIEANPNIDPNNLQIGQKICVPRGIIEPKG